MQGKLTIDAIKKSVKRETTANDFPPPWLQSNIDLSVQTQGNLFGWHRIFVKFK